MILKVVRMNKTKYVRLPNDWCEENNVNSGDELHFIETKSGELIIYPKGVE